MMMTRCTHCQPSSPQTHKPSCHTTQPPCNPRLDNDDDDDGDGDYNYEKRVLNLGQAFISLSPSIFSSFETNFFLQSHHWLHNYNINSKFGAVWGGLVNIKGNLKIENCQTLRSITRLLSRKSKLQRQTGLQRRCRIGFISWTASDCCIFVW